MRLGMNFTGNSSRPQSWVARAQTLALDVNSLDEVFRPFVSPTSALFEQHRGQ